MTKRNPILDFVFSIITLFIYGLVWLVSTKGELNKRGASIPTAWIMLIPFASIYWMWRYSEGVGKVTNNKVSDILAFLLLLALGPIGVAVLQSKYNEI